MDLNKFSYSEDFRKLKFNMEKKVKYYILDTKTLKLDII